MGAHDNRNNPPLNRKLHHDLKAQLINVRGFCAEIEKTANELVKLRESHSNQKAENTDSIGHLISDDLLPCIKYLALSTGKLDDLIVEYSASTSDTRRPQ